MPSTVHRPTASSLLSCAFPARARRVAPGAIRLGVFPGEGIGPEVMAAALHVLDATAAVHGLRLEIVTGGPIGLDAEAQHGTPLSASATALCADVLDTGGAILQGPGGGRFVYDLRRRFELFCKLVPLRAHPALVASSRLKAEHVEGVDMVIVRDNAGGVYQGTWEASGLPGARVATHTFSYDEGQVRAIVGVAARVAAARRGELLVVAKEGGVPSISRLWRDVAEAEAARAGVRMSVANVDLVAYQMMHDPRSLDVVVTPNLVGDVLADLGAVLEGGRGISYSGNYTPAGAGVYQTNHGAAYDLAGRDIANPVGQILSVAMALRESFDRPDAATLIEAAVEHVWRGGHVTADLPVRGASVVGCIDMGRRVADAVTALGRR